MPNPKGKASKPAEAEQENTTVSAAPPRPIHLDVRINSITPGSENVRATASVNMNGCFAVRGIRIMEGSRGLFVSMPSYKNGSKYDEHCFPVTKEFRDQLHGAILNAYQQAPTASRDQSVSPPRPTDIAVRINSIRPGGGPIRAFASVNLNGSFAIRGVKVIDGTNGLSVHMPSYKASGEYKEHCFPTTKEFRQQLSDAVMSAYEQAVALVESASQQNTQQEEACESEQGFSQAM